MRSSKFQATYILSAPGLAKTFARITILWGLTSVATMFVKTAASFFIVRFLLGCFEAGLLPGVVLYMTYWFPARRRALMLAMFFTSMPLTSVLGSPVSGWIMGSMRRSMGFANWQWLFLLEGVPSIVVGLLALLIVVDRPDQAKWLNEREKHLVLEDLEADHREAGSREHGLGQALKLPRVWLLTLIHFCGVSSNVTIGFWVPTIIRDLGVTNTAKVGLLSAVPYLVAVVSMVLVSRHSDRTMERRYHAAIPCLVSALGLIGIGVFAHYPALAFTALIVTVAGALSYNGPFWQIPPMMLAGTAAAGGIALINSLGSLSGWAGPSVVGWLEDMTGKTAAGLYVVAAVEIVGAVLILLFMPRTNLFRLSRTENGSIANFGPPADRVDRCQSRRAIHSKDVTTLAR